MKKVIVISLVCFALVACKKEVSKVDTTKVQGQTSSVKK